MQVQHHTKYTNVICQSRTCKRRTACQRRIRQRRTTWRQCMSFEHLLGGVVGRSGGRHALKCEEELKFSIADNFRSILNEGRKQPVLIRARVRSSCQKSEANNLADKFKSIRVSNIHVHIYTGPTGEPTLEGIDGSALSLLLSASANRLIRSAVCFWLSE